MFSKLSKSTEELELEGGWGNIIIHYGIWWCLTGIPGHCDNSSRWSSFWLLQNPGCVFAQGTWCSEPEFPSLSQKDILLAPSLFELWGKLKDLEECVMLFSLRRRVQTLCMREEFCQTVALQIWGAVECGSSSLRFKRQTFSKNDSRNWNKPELRESVRHRERKRLGHFSMLQEPERASPEVSAADAWHLLKCARIWEPKRKAARGPWGEGAQVRDQGVCYGRERGVWAEQGQWGWRGGRVNSSQAVRSYLSLLRKTQLWEKSVQWQCRWTVGWKWWQEAISIALTEDNEFWN